jgi:TnpA family transposase
MFQSPDPGRFSVRVGLEGLPKDLSSSEVARHFHLEGAVREAVVSVREPGARMALAVQAGAVRTIGRLLADPGRVPLLVIEYLAEDLGMKPIQPEPPARAMTRWDQERRLCEALRVRRYEPGKDRELLVQRLATVAKEALGEDGLLAEAELCLRREGILLPALRNLRRLVRDCRRRAIEAALLTAGEGLDKNSKLRLHRLLEPDSKTEVSDLVWLSQPPGDPKTDNLEDLVARKKRIEDLGLDLQRPLGVGEAMREYLVQRAQAYSPWALERLPAETKYGLLVLRVREQYRRILDWITFMHGTILHGVRRKAKNAILKKAGTLTHNLPELMTLLGDVCEIVLEHARTPALIGPELLRRFGLDAFQDTLDRARSFTARGAETSWDYLYRRHGTVKAVTDLFLEGVELVSTHGEDPVLGAVEFYQEHVRRRRAELPPEAPLDFVPTSWRDRVVDEKGVVQRKAWQLCLAEQVTEKIRNGQLAIPGSASFEELGRYVVPAETWARERDRRVESLGIDADPVRHLGKLKDELDEGARRAMLETQREEGVRIVHGRLVVTPLEEEKVPEKEERACQEVRAGVRTRRIEELLLEVDERTHFLDSFTHLGSGRVIPRGDWEARTALLSAILAKGFNHGLATLARSIEGMTRWKIETAAEQYLRQETIQAATARLVDFQRSIPISQAWGDGRTGSADGRRSKVLGESLYAGYNPRYFPGYKRGIVTLTHVADVQTPFYTQVIPISVREAGYVLDGLLGHGSGLRIEQLYVDSHGVTEPVAAVCHLLGIRLAPRIANLRDKRLWLSEGMKRSNYGALGRVFSGTVRRGLIAEHWEEMLRMASSIREGHVKPSVLIRKIASLPRSAPLFKAWQDLGRLVITHWVLDYVSDPKLRRTVLVGLNKGEEVHAIGKTFFHGTDGGFRTGDHLAQLHATSCLNLLIASVSVANTLELDRVWREKGGAEKIPLRTLRHLSPLSSESVIYLGKYWFPKEAEGPAFPAAQETA